MDYEERFHAKTLVRDRQRKWPGPQYIGGRARVR